MHFVSARGYCCHTGMLFIKEKCRHLITKQLPLFWNGFCKFLIKLPLMFYVHGHHNMSHDAPNLIRRK